jgi:ubiquinone/menaquinone biosynthesis C-methylase UbiE
MEDMLRSYASLVVTARALPLVGPSAVGRLAVGLTDLPLARSSALAPARRALDCAQVEGRAPSPTETWDAFFGDFYLRAYADDVRQGEAERQARAAAKLARCPPEGELLDVPCGFGRHSLPLAAAGYRVVGVDRSEVLLAEARRRAGDGGSPKLVRADYRELPFEDESFDAALNLFTSLGYLGDEADTNVLGEIRRVLRPGARLVVETLHRDLLVRGFRERDWTLLGEGRLLVEQRTFDATAGVAQTTQTLIDGSGERDSRTFSVRVYSATELLSMVERAGFAEARCYGDVDGGSFTTDTRLVVAATR